VSVIFSIIASAISIFNVAAIITIVLVHLLIYGFDFVSFLLLIYGIFYIFKIIAHLWHAFELHFANFILNNLGFQFLLAAQCQDFFWIELS